MTHRPPVGDQAGTISSDNPILAVDQAPTLEAAPEDERTLIFFPLCWQACLIGNLTKLDVDTDAFEPIGLKILQSRYLQDRCRFAYAPKPLAT